MSYVDSLHLPNRNSLDGRRNGSKPHPHLLVSRGAACKYCSFHFKSSRLVQQHITREHWKPDHSPHWVRDGVSLHVSLQSWTQNGNRTYWAVDVTSEGFNHLPVGMTTQSPRRRKWLKTLHEEEKRRAEQSGRGHDFSNTGMYDEALVGNWMRRTDWMAIFSGVNRKLLVRLTEAPATDGLALSYGVFDGTLLQSDAEDERRIRLIGMSMDKFFDRCEDTVRHTGHSIRCWLRSHLPNRPYKAPFQLPFRHGTRSRYRGLWKRLLYFCFRLYRLDPAAHRTILRHELTEEQSIALGKVWSDPCWTEGPSGEQFNGHVESDVELEPSTRCSSMTSMTSMTSMRSPSADSASLILMGKAGEPESKIVLTGPCRAFDHSVSELENKDDFIDLGLDDWPICEDSDDSIRSLPQRATLRDRTGSVIARRCDQGQDDIAQERMANILGELSHSLCCEEFVDGRSSTTILVYFCAVLGISNDGSTFDRPRNYTPKLSAMIHSARLVCLGAALPRHNHSHVGWSARPRNGQLDELNRVRERFMCIGSQAPLGELLSLRSYGRAFSRTDGPSFRVRWSDDGETVSWADGKLCLREFRSFAKRAMDSADELLRVMMYGMRPRFDLTRFRDDMSATKQGYSFVQDPRNNLAMKYLDLSSQACLDSENGLMSGESWNLKAVRNYLDLDQHSKASLLSRGHFSREVTSSFPYSLRPLLPLSFPLPLSRRLQTLSSFSSSSAASFPLSCYASPPYLLVLLLLLLPDLLLPRVHRHQFSWTACSATFFSPFARDLCSFCLSAFPPLFFAFALSLDAGPALATWEALALALALCTSSNLLGVQLVASGEPTIHNVRLEPPTDRMFLPEHREQLHKDILTQDTLCGLLDVCKAEHRALEDLWHAITDCGLRRHEGTGARSQASTPEGLTTSRLFHRTAVFRVL